MRTARLIIYDGPQEWMVKQRGRDLQTPYMCGNGASIHSVEIPFEDIPKFTGDVSAEKFTDCGRPKGSPYEGQE